MQQQKLVAGDSLNFLTAGGAYPASSGWVLKYRLAPRTAGGTPIDITSTAEGDDHRVAIAASTSANWSADVYTWASWVEKAGEVYSVDEGVLEIAPNPRNLPAGTDGRSLARKALDDARAAFATWSPLRKRYRIGMREMEFGSTADILVQIRFWEAEVAKEDAAAARAKGRNTGGRFFVRMVR